MGSAEGAEGQVVTEERVFWRPSKLALILDICQDLNIFFREKIQAILDWNPLGEATGGVEGLAQDEGLETDNYTACPITTVIEIVKLLKEILDGQELVQGSDLSVNCLEKICLLPEGESPKLNLDSLSERVEDLKNLLKRLVQALDLEVSGGWTEAVEMVDKALGPVNDILKRIEQQQTLLESLKDESVTVLAKQQIDGLHIDLVDSEDAAFPAIARANFYKQMGILLSKVLSSQMQILEEVSRILDERRTVLASAPTDSSQIGDAEKGIAKALDTKLRRMARTIHIIGSFSMKHLVEERAEEKADETSMYIAKLLVFYERINRVRIGRVSMSLLAGPQKNIWSEMMRRGVNAKSISSTGLALDVAATEESSRPRPRKAHSVLHVFSRLIAAKTDLVCSFIDAMKDGHIMPEALAEIWTVLMRNDLQDVEEPKNVVRKLFLWLTENKGEVMEMEAVEIRKLLTVFVTHPEARKSGYVEEILYLKRGANEGDLPTVQRWRGPVLAAALSGDPKELGEDFFTKVLDSAGDINPKVLNVLVDVILMYEQLTGAWMRECARLMRSSPDKVPQKCKDFFNSRDGSIPPTEEVPKVDEGDTLLGAKRESVANAAEFTAKLASSVAHED